MREILFRGKQTDNGEWIEGYYATQSNHACFANELKHQHFIFKDICLDFNLGGLQEFEVIPKTVGEYTDLCDRRGTKIFEGDIVSYRGEHAVIAYDEETARFCLSFDTWSTDFDHLYGKDVEVVGNIHDNPELLKGGE